ncbi:protein shisa-6 isoform X2 [Labrus mixtus]|uniref:protein shisa-6 isoform X2 n=1 Tax=Labrus mixtus TaxID=508554 RepID=UPI0029C03955|nr:protein shisa-6 isoform X2 [Labrus mixtus]
MKPAASRGMFRLALALLLFPSCLAVSTVTISTVRRAAVDGNARTLSGGGGSSPAAGKKSTALFLLTGYKPPLPPLPAGPKVAPKAAEVEDGDDRPVVAELPPKPLPQTMLPRNMTADALKPPLGAAQVAPPPRQLVDVDVCRGYYDVMGHFDTTFNCSKGSYIYCCGTCHYRFCCEHQRSRLDQEACNNYISPVWADPLVPPTVPVTKPDPDLEMLQQQNSSTAYVIGGVISFTLVVAVGVRIAFSKVARRPRNRDVNMPRSLVDILRHQSSPVQQGERNNMTSTTSDGRPSKNLYTPILQSKDNRKRGPRMNNTPQLSSGPTLISSSVKGPGGGGGGSIFGGGMRHSNSHSSFSHSFHNLAQLPPSYELAMKPEISRYSSLKKLEKELDEYSSYYNSKRRSNNAAPYFYSSQNHLPWAGEYTLGSSRGTLPLNGSGSSSRPRTHIPSTPNPYPLPGQSHYTSSSFDRPPRRVRSQDQLLGYVEGNSLSRLSKNQQHQYYKAMMSNSRGNNGQTLRRSHERLLVSPDRLEDQLMAMGLIIGGDRGGMVPTMGRLSHHQKAQSQQNICVTPSMDRHHMVKMNSHPTPSHDRSSAAMQGMGMHGGWDPHGGGPGGGHPNARRMAFANKRQNTIEQLHFIPGGGGGVHGLRTGSKNEVTV